MMEKFGLRIRDSIGKDIDKQLGIQKFETMNWSIFSACCMNIKRLVPSKCRCLCLRENTRERMFNRGYDKL